MVWYKLQVLFLDLSVTDKKSNKVTIDSVDCILKCEDLHTVSDRTIVEKLFNLKVILKILSLCLNLRDCFCLVYKNYPLESKALKTDGNTIRQISCFCN